MKKYSSILKLTDRSLFVTNNHLGPSGLNSNVKCDRCPISPMTNFITYRSILLRIRPPHKSKDITVRDEPNVKMQICKI